MSQLRFFPCVTFRIPLEGDRLTCGDCGWAASDHDDESNTPESRLGESNTAQCAETREVRCMAHPDSFLGMVCANTQAGWVLTLCEVTPSGNVRTRWQAPLSHICFDGGGPTEDGLSSKSQQPDDGTPDGGGA